MTDTTDRIRLTAEQLDLAHARAEVACGRFATATSLLIPLAESADSAIALRATLQLALVSYGRGDAAAAVELLSQATRIVEGQRAYFREQDELAERPAGGGAVVAAYREAQLELARTWRRIDRSDEARAAYFALLREGGIEEARTPAEEHLAALAEHRLAELLVGEEPRQAYEHWRRALESRDERVAPYAALRMATELGSEILVKGRVEWLFHQAMACHDPKLRSEATLGLARHLKHECQFGEARRYLEEVIAEGYSNHAEEAASELKALDREESEAPVRQQLARARQLRARAVVQLEDVGPSSKRVLVVGAGTGGAYLLESLEGAGERYTICGFVDDNAHEVPGYPQYRILGRIDELIEVIHNHSPHQVLLAIPTLAGARRHAVVEACRKTDTTLLNLPRMHELGIGWTLKESRRRLMAQLRPVEVEETIGHERVELDRQATGWLQYRTALVVGAGALGAEISRRLADGGVRQLVLVDRRQSALRKVQNDLADTRDFHLLEPLVCDAVDRSQMAMMFRYWAPDVVFNSTGNSSALALEPRRLGCDPEGWRTVLRNEIHPALAVARAAVDAEVPRTVYLSSRRAGVPDDPFAAVKAFAENLVLMHAAERPNALLSVVRVGTLLDSRNGRLARLKQQIRTGAPVRIPNRDATVKYLSTARWAELVLHAARLSENGDLLELDAGEDVRIRYIAEEAIRLFGQYPDDDVLIEEVPGDRWEDPVSDEPRRARDESLGVFSLERQTAGEQMMEQMVALCGTLIEVHGGGPAGAVEAAVREVVEDVDADVPFVT